jgi:hypothetical protein
MCAGVRTLTAWIVVVVTFMASGRPVHAIAHAFRLDERTVARWRDRAGQHGETLHHVLVEQGNLDLVPVHTDDMRMKGRTMRVWMGRAMISTRVWLAGTVRMMREKTLAA